MGTADPKELFSTHDHADVGGAYPTERSDHDVTDAELEANHPIYAGGYYV